MCHVLIIEDDFFTSDYLEVLTGSAGATSFDQACTQDEAVRMALARRPAVILCDVALLEGTGLAAVRAIDEALRGIPVIFVTGTPELCRPCAPPNVVLTKPLRDVELVDAFRAVMPA